MIKLLTIKTALIVTFTLVVVLGAAQFVLANEMSTEGQGIRDLEEQKFQLQNEVRNLEKQVAALGSLSGVETQAKEFGFSYTSQAFEYFSSPKLAQAK